METWEGQVALVTGAARGIGRAIALRLAREGAAVCVNYVTSVAAADMLVTEIQEEGGRAIAIAADVADETAVNTMIDRVKHELGDPTILVNNAGTGYSATLDNYSSEIAGQMRRVNVDGMIHTTRAVIEAMRHRHFGRIVNLGSAAAFGTTRPGNSFYGGNKAEVHLLTRRFAMELGRHGITVNAVAPGVVKTDMTIQNRNETDWHEVAKTLGALSMVGRVGDPEDVAEAVAFFASPTSGWVTAQILSVDGGRMDYIGH